MAFRESNLSPESDPKTGEILNDPGSERSSEKIRVSKDIYLNLQTFIAIQDKYENLNPESDDFSLRRLQLREILDNLARNWSNYFQFQDDLRSFKEGKIEPEEMLELGVKEGRLLEGDIPGRAEYEDLRNMNLFEDKSPSLETFPWVRVPGFGSGMIIASRGSGKTFFIEKLMDEIPVEIHILNKENLRYEQKGAREPKLIVLDDLHYLLEAKRKSEIDSELPKVTGEEILEYLERAVERAKRLNIKIVFISTGTPIDLYDRFSNKADQIRFLEIMKDCGVSNSDIEALRSDRPVQGVSEFRKSRGNILWFREAVDVELMNNLREQIGASDIPLFNMDYSESGGALVTVEGKEVAGILRGSLNSAKRDIFVSKDELTKERDEDKKKRALPPIARIRELVALSKKFGKLNRETLGIDFGIPHEETFAGEEVKTERKSRIRVLPEHAEIISSYKDFLANIKRSYEDAIKENESILRLDLDRSAEYRRMPIEQIIADQEGLLKIEKAIQNHKRSIKSNLNGLYEILYGSSSVRSKSFLNYLRSKGAQINQSYLSKVAAVVRYYDPEKNPDLKVGDILFERSESILVGYNRGERNKGAGWVYSKAQISKIEKRIKDLYFELTRKKDVSTLAQKLLSLGEYAGQEDVERAYLDYAMEQE